MTYHMCCTRTDTVRRSLSFRDCGMTIPSDPASAPHRLYSHSYEVEKDAALGDVCYVRLVDHSRDVGDDAGGVTGENSSVA